MGIIDRPQPLGQSTVIASGSVLTGALNVIHRATFSYPYSCQGSYGASALFLSDYSKQRNSPDLIHNGACGSEDYVEATTAGAVGGGGLAQRPPIVVVLLFGLLLARRRCAVR